MGLPYQGAISQRHLIDELLYVSILNFIIEVTIYLLHFADVCK